MKTLLSLLLLCLPGSSLLAKSQAVPFSLKSATVYRHGAQLAGEVRFSLQQGRQTLRVSRLPASIAPESVQVGGQGNFTILGVKTVTNFLSQEEKSQKLKALRDSLQKTENKLEEQQLEAEITKEKLAFLRENRQVAGKESALTADQLENVADYYGRRMAQLMKTQLQQHRQAKATEERIEKLQKAIEAIERGQGNGNLNIEVALEAKAGGAGKLELQFLVREASWSPKYEVRYNGKEEPLQFRLRGLVQQQTGLDWEQIALTLSTGDPARSGSKPRLPRARVYLKPENRGRPTPSRAYKRKAEEAGSNAPRAKMATDEAQSSADYTRPTQTAFNRQFEIELRYDIPTHSQPEVVDLQNSPIPAQYQNNCVPRLSEKVFLTATISNLEKHNLLAAKADIFQNGTFVGETRLTPQEADSLLVSLGVNQFLKVRFERSKDYESKSFLGGKKTENYGYSLKISNMGNKKAELVLQDAIPQSTHEDIEVELQKKAGAHYDPNRGKLTWEKALKPGEEKAWQYAFSIRYPKKRRLKFSGLQY